MKAIQIYQSITERITNAKDLSLLFFRLVLAYGFYGPAMMKWGNINSVAEWFGSMGIPMPTLNVYMAASTEIAGVVLLTLGLATRIISIPLIITMVVAIATVHLGNGFESGNNGFEIPLYYILMLFALLVNGAGKISLDNVISRRLKWMQESSLSSAS